jgi:hypothetical protein
MRIGGSQNQVPGPVRRRSRAVAGYAVVVWSAVLLVLFCLWRPGGVPVAGLFSLVLGVAALVHAGWATVRGRRRARLAAAEAAVREQRLAAADPGARRRRDLLDAVEEHGGLSPEARAAAAEIARHRTQ